MPPNNIHRDATRLSILKPRSLHPHSARVVLFPSLAPATSGHEFSKFKPSLRISKGSRLAANAGRTPHRPTCIYKLSPVLVASPPVVIRQGKNRYLDLVGQGEGGGDHSDKKKVCTIAEV